MADRLTLVVIEQLEECAKKLTAKGERDSANDALLLTYLIDTLRANAQRDIVIARMAAHIDELDREHRKDSALHSHAYQSLLGEFRMLQKQQDELREQLLMHATVIDVGIEKISAAVRKIESVNENLLESVDDLTDP